ncbi:MAG: 50S ribosomal protein L3 [bacterium]
MQGILGKKIGMTRVFGEEGRQIPVTVIEVGPCVIVQRKTKSQDGYEALKLGFIEVKASRANKAHVGQFKVANVAPTRFLREFTVESGEEMKAGDTVTAAILDGVDYVDIIGVTKGRGFAGVVRRFRMRGGPMTHGGHSKRRVGSIGCRSFPGRVHKGKHMPGHMGNVQVTTQNLKVVQLRASENLLLVNGAVPGPAGALVEIRKALKKTKAGQVK